MNVYNVFGWPLQFLLVVTPLRQRRRCSPFAQQGVGVCWKERPRPRDDVSSSAAPTGVTALFPLSQGVVVGDKRGILRLQRLTKNDSQRARTVTTTTDATFFGRHVNGLTSRRPSPIFCVTGNDNDRNSNSNGINTIFSGAGDRYVSVWELDDQGNWVFADALGPHTGWVRDVLFDATSERLHSIGCNCIETWTRSEKGGTWEHCGKSTIESSVQEGATLSSDLLCLCKCIHPYLLSGGVDGRVHVWDSSSMGSPRFSFPAHNGRLNAMVYRPQRNVVYTAGNDGHVKCWNVAALDSGRFDLINTYHTGNEISRITCLANLPFWTFLDYLLCGTSSGEVILLGSPCEVSEQPSLRLVTTFQLMNQPTVHSICVHEQDKEPILWVGHSAGCSVFPLSDFVNLTNLQTSKFL